MTITLDAIKTEQTRIAEMIAAFEQARIKRTVQIPYTKIELNDGEHYAGIILGEGDAKAHHLILLPGEADSIAWGRAKEWATETGGALPNRREQSLLYANLKEQFQQTWYWSSTQHASDSDYAWCQTFDYGYQDTYYKSAELRARAVRRLVIE